MYALPLALLLALLREGPLCATALAAPDRVAATWTVASPTEWALAQSGESIAILGDAFTLLDTGTWDTTSVAVCSAAGSPRGVTAGIRSVDDVSIDVYWIGCGDGTVERVDVAGGSPTLSADVLTAGTTAVTAIDTDGTYLYVVMAGDSGLAELTGMSPDDERVLSGYPTTLSTDRLVDTLLFDGSLYVLHGGDDLSRITTSNAAVYLTTQATGADYQTATRSDAGQIYLTDKTGGDLWLFDTGSNAYTLLVNDIGDETTALALDEPGGWAAVSVDSDLSIYDYSGGSFGSEAERVYDTGSFGRLATITDPAGGVSSLLAMSEADSLLSVLTEGPWVEITSAPASAGSGSADVPAEASVSFTSDLDGDWTLWLGDALADATELDSGSIDAGDTVTATATVGEAWIEGRNRLWVTVDGGNAIGHDATDVTVDTPPPQMVTSVGFGESSIHVQIAADDTEDLDHYLIYLSDAVFSAGDWVTGGPTLAIEGLTAPVELGATPGSGGSYTFYPLENGTTYWAAVRAFDAGGLEGPMSDVLSATPRYTYSASELRGDDGGFSCSAAAMPAGRAALVLGLVVSGAVALVCRRRRADGFPG